MEIFLALTMVDVTPYHCCKFGIMGGHHTSLTRSHIFCRVEREAPCCPERSYFFPVIYGSMCLGCILNKMYSPLTTDLCYRSDSERQPEEMHPDNSTGFL